MIRKIIYIVIFTFLLQVNVVNAGSTGSEELKSDSSQNTAGECFEGFSRIMFKFNHGLDKAIFEPVAKGYRALPVPIRRGTGNMVDNLRSLLTFSNNILQGDFRKAGNTVGRFAINTTVGVLGIWDPASALGIKENGKEDFGQTMGVWGSSTGCYFVLPILGPTDSTRLNVKVFPNAVVSLSEISLLEPENCVLIRTSSGLPNSIISEFLKPYFVSVILRSGRFTA